MSFQMNRLLIRAALRLLPLMCAACSVGDGVLGRVVGEGGGIDGGVVLATEGCALTSPLVTLQQHPTCTGRLAASRFSKALCTCGDLRLGNYLVTHGFDSSQGPYRAGQSDDGGAAVGVNLNYSLSVGATDVAGSFSLAGGADLQLVGALSVRGDFYSAGNVSVTGATTVSRDAWLGGGFSGLGPLTVGGALYHTGTVVALPVLATPNQRQTVSVASPCPCSASELLDISALVDAAKVNNDNGRLGISSDDLASVSETTQWTLSCGRVFLSKIAGPGKLAVHVTGLAALFVDGSIDLARGLSFDIDPGAEVDVFVKQDLRVQGALSLASQDRPAAGRIWVGGTQPITLASPWVGNLYAPGADVVAAIALDAWGSIFAHSFKGGASASFTFDRAVVAAGANCPASRPPAGLCTQCQWCSGGDACMSGVCGLCTTDGDCCSLSVCSNGRCEPLVAATGS